MNDSSACKRLALFDLRYNGRLPAAAGNPRNQHSETHATKLRTNHYEVTQDAASSLSDTVCIFIGVDLSFRMETADRRPREN